MTITDSIVLIAIIDCKVTVMCHKDTPIFHCICQMRFVWLLKQISVYSCGDIYAVVSQPVNYPWVNMLIAVIS